MRAACVCQTALVAAEPGDARNPLARAQEALDAAAGTELDPQVVQALTALLQRARSA